MSVEEIKKRHLKDAQYIADFSANSVHMDWIEEIHADRAELLDKIQELEQQL